MAIVQPAEETDARKASFDRALKGRWIATITTNHKFPRRRRPPPHMMAPLIASSTPLNG